MLLNDIEQILAGVRCSLKSYYQKSSKECDFKAKKFVFVKQTFLEKESNISSHTSVDWTNFCREIIHVI